MKCLVLHEWVKSWGNNLKIEERQKPSPGSGEALVRVRACGVGLTVSNFLIGESSGGTSTLPRIPGHEIAGEIVSLGPGTESDFKEKDKVLVYFYLHCNNCEYCLRGLQPLCLNFRGFVGINVDGGYAEYLKVPINNLIRLPDGVPFRDATVINDAVATPVHVLSQRAQVRPSENVLIIGAAGGVGIHAVQVAKVFGTNVTAVDISDEKLESTRKYGADHVINSLSNDLKIETSKVTGGLGMDVVIDFVGTRKTITDGFECLGRRGRLINMTTHPGVAFEVPLRGLVNKEVTVTGSRYTTKYEFSIAAELIRSGKVKPVISRSSGLEGVEHIHEALAENSMIGRGALIF